MFVKLVTSAQNSVVIGSFQHIIPVVFAYILTILLVSYYKINFNSFQKQRTVQYIGWFVSFTIVPFYV